MGTKSSKIAEFTKESHPVVKFCCYRDGRTGRKGCGCCERTTFFVYTTTLLGVILLMWFLVPRPPCIGFEEAYFQNVAIGNPSPVLPSSFGADVFVKLNIDNPNYISIDITGLDIDVYYLGNITIPTCCTRVFTKIGTIIKKDTTTIQAQYAKNKLTLTTRLYTQDPQMLAGLYEDKQRNYVTLVLDGDANIALGSAALTFHLDMVPVRVPLS